MSRREPLIVQVPTVLSLIICAVCGRGWCERHAQARTARPQPRLTVDDLEPFAAEEDEG